MTDNSDTLAVLARSPLFEMLSDQELQCLAGLSRRVDLPAGQAVFQEGELGDSVYVIMSGEVELLRRDGAGASRVIAQLGPPEFFGEMSLVDKEFRSATARARTQLTLLHISAEQLTAFRGRFPDGFTFVVMNIARVLSSRLREANARLAR